MNDFSPCGSCKVYLFVATLPFSMYCYAQACRTMKEEDWIKRCPSACTVMRRPAAP